MRFIVYNPDNGQVVGRIQTVTANRDLYPNRIELSDVDFDTKPETWAEVDIALIKQNELGAAVPQTLSRLVIKARAGETVPW